MPITKHRLAEMDAMVANLVAQARPVLAAASPGARVTVMKEIEAGLERTYAVMLGQSGPLSEEAILIVEKIRDALTRLAAS